MSASNFYVDLNSVADSWPEGLVVLMYHSVAAPPIFYGMRALYVTPRHLAKQLRELKASSGAAFPTLSEWNSAHPSKRQVIITFDDAYLSLFESKRPTGCL